jgi:hypothetical protein
MKVLQAFLSLVAGIILGVGGTLAFNSTNLNKADHSGHNESTNSTTHAHKEIEINADLPIPSVNLTVIEDIMGGYNLKLDFTNFTLTPEKVNMDNVPNEGHVHLYINQVGVARIYGQWYNIKKDQLKTGENIIQVTLNANDHSDWTLNGMHIEDTETVIVK